MTNEREVVCLVRDLLFYSKIRAAADSARMSIQSLRDPAQLADSSGSRLIVDLNQEGNLTAAAAWRQRTGGRVVGFVSHVDSETIAAAKRAGIDQILTRSQFEKNLAGILSASELC